MRQNALSLQSSVVGRANLRTYIQAAKAADIHELLGNLEISSVGWLSDIERRGGDEISLLREAGNIYIYKIRIPRAGKACKRISDFIL